MLSRHHLSYFDWPSFILTFMLCGLSMLFVYSATYTPENPYSIFFKKQVIGVISGFVIYLGFMFTDYQSLIRGGYFGYLGVIFLLIFTLIKGSIGMGAQRWIHFIFFKIQTSELAKFCFPAFTAHYFYAHKHNKHLYFWDFVPVLLILCISFILILKQPDLGTALIILFSGLVIVWLAGITKKFFLYSFIFVTLATPLLWKVVLKPYQKRRIAVFLGEGESHKERYQIEQAKIAIGSGGLFGKGWTQGTQNTLQFLPESRTDFIFAVICEEWGFIGALTVLFLYFLLFFRLISLIWYISIPHVKLLASGIVMYIIFSTLINIAMVLGLLPIVGIPLPLMSYGLSNLWITCASLGWLQSIVMREFHVSKYSSLSIKSFAKQ